VRVSKRKETYRLNRIEVRKKIKIRIETAINNVRLNEKNAIAAKNIASTRYKKIFNLL
jgi:hypothetical protein